MFFNHRKWRFVTVSLEDAFTYFLLVFMLLVSLCKLATPNKITHWHSPCPVLPSSYWPDTWHSCMDSHQAIQCHSYKTAWPSHLTRWTCSWLSRWVLGVLLHSQLQWEGHVIFAPLFSQVNCRHSIFSSTL